MRQCIIYSFVAVRTSFGVTGQILGRWSRFVPPRGSYTDFVELFHELEFLQYRLEVRTAELNIPPRYQFSAKLSFQDLQDSPERRSPDFIYDIWTRLYRTNWLPLSPQNGICISRRFYLVSISNSCPVSLIRPYFQLRDYLSWYGSRTSSVHYGTMVQIMRSARYLLMFRHATFLSTHLQFTGTQLNGPHYRKRVLLTDLLDLSDYTPDTFNSPQARYLRSLVPR